MNRRDFLAASAAIPLAARASLAAGTPLTPMTGSSSSVKLGIDLFSLRAQKWSPFQYLDYCAQRKVQVVHFSEVRFIGGLQPDHLRKVREHAEALGIELEIGMRSICPSSKMFDPKDGTADEQLSRMLDSAQIVGSKIVRCVLGSADDRKPGPIEAHMEDMVRVLRSARPKAKDLGLKIAVENHAGDMQARELRILVEEAGPDFVGVCLDSGNPLWTIEDPHLTLEVLHPYVLTSHVRDSAVWKTPQGAAVTWVQMGRGNVAIDEYVRKYSSLCAGKALSLESILLGPREYPYRQPAFWDAYRKTPAWEFQRFVEIAERGRPYQNEAWETADEAKRERDALDESLAYTKKVLGLTA
jgi:3-oxoisoapionate decarboxylase